MLLGQIPCWFFFVFFFFLSLRKTKCNSLMWWKGRSCQAQVKLLEEMNLQQSSGHYGHVQSCKMISAPFEGKTSL